MVKSRNPLRVATNPWDQFHAYVLGNLIGVRWGGTLTPYNGMIHRGLYEIVREYLTYAAGDDEWKKLGVLDAMRGKSGTAIKNDTRSAFPSLFPRNQRAKPFGIPQELEGEEVNFDPALIEEWASRVRTIKQEMIMNENLLQGEVTEEGTSATATSTTTSSRVTVNFFIPEGTNPEDLTLENYRETTGKRFRMTKEQKARGLSREAAFAESRALATQQLGG